MQAQKQKQTVKQTVIVNIPEKKIKKRKKVVKKQIKPPILPSSMRVINASQFPTITSMGLAENIATALRPQVSGIMQNTRPRTIFEERRDEGLLDQERLREKRIDRFDKTAEESEDLIKKSEDLIKRVDESKRLEPESEEQEDSDSFIDENNLDNLLEQQNKELEEIISRSKTRIPSDDIFIRQEDLPMTEGGGRTTEATDTEDVDLSMFIRPEDIEETEKL